MKAKRWREVIQIFLMACDEERILRPELLYFVLSASDLEMQQTLKQDFGWRRNEMQRGQKYNNYLTFNILSSSEQ